MALDLAERKAWLEVPRDRAYLVDLRHVLPSSLLCFTLSGAVRK